MNTNRTTTGGQNPQNARSGTSTNRGNTPASGKPVAKVVPQASASGKVKINGNSPILASSRAPSKAPASLRKVSGQGSAERKTPAPLVVNMSKVAGRVRAFKSNDEVDTLLREAQAMGNESRRNSVLLDLAMDAQIDPLQRLEAAKAIKDQSLHDTILIQLAKNPQLSSFRKGFINAITDATLRDKGLRWLKQGPKPAAVAPLKLNVRLANEVIQEEPLPIINQAALVLKVSKDEQHRQKALDSTQNGLSRLLSAKDIKDETLHDETCLKLVKDTNMDLHWRRRAAEAITDVAKKGEALSIIEKAARELEKEQD